MLTRIGFWTQKSIRKHCARVITDLEQLILEGIINQEMTLREVIEVLASDPREWPVSPPTRSNDNENGSNQSTEAL